MLHTMIDQDRSQPLKLFSSDGTVTAIRSPIRSSILFLLCDEGEVSFARIMEYTGLSKSTVSVHVNSLIEAGLIAARVVPGDARKKRYFLTSSHVGEIVGGQKTGKDEFRELLRQCYIKYDNVDYRQIIPHIIQIALMEAGVQIDPIMMRGGMILGESISQYLVAESLEKTLEHLTRFWTRYSLGEMHVRSMNPLRLEIYKCYECMVLPKSNKGCCVISKGILLAVFRAFYKQDVVVEEIECMAQGFPACCFEITEPERRPESLPEDMEPV